jgi:Beta-propeller repeat
MLNSRYLLGLALTALPLVTTLPASNAQATPLVVNKEHTLTTARYLGGVGNNEARATAFMKGGDILVGGNFASLQTAANRGQALSGISNTAPGKLLRLSADGKKVLAHITLGQRIDSLQLRDHIVVGGDFGVAVLDANFKLLWRNSLPGLAAGNGKADGGQTRVAVEPSGRVAVLRDKTVTLFSAEGKKLAARAIPRDYVTNIAIDPFGRRVYVVGYANRKSGQPVQVSFLHALDSQRNLQELWRTWDFDPQLLSDPKNNNMADARLYHVVVAPDGNLVVSGESAGGNSIYRWNGKDLSTSTLVSTDMYNKAYNTASNHILYYGKVNAANGNVIAGQLTLTRLPKEKGTKGNTIRARDGSLAVDKKGRIYIGGIAAYGIAERDTNKINGQTVSPYAGSDMYFLMVSPDLKQRLRWTAFSASPKGGGTLNALAVQNNNVALFGTVDFGEMITTNGNKRFNAIDGKEKDAYFTILKTN